MKVEEKGNTIIIRDTQNDPDSLIEKIIRNHKSYETHNLIVDISHDQSVSSKSLRAFLPLSKQHRKLKKSFVLVASGIDFNDAPDALNVVPTLLEAHDMIEMDEIERDLNF